jgi:hypothetical protein
LSSYSTNRFQFCGLVAGQKSGILTSNGTGIEIMSVSLELFRMRYSSKKVQFNQVQTVFEQDLIVKFYTIVVLFYGRKLAWKNQCVNGKM